MAQYSLKRLINESNLIRKASNINERHDEDDDNEPSSSKIVQD